ncbi:hypothetical protein [Bacillus testis]|uniref:hypothetical protein n=1 Tax=Bacillus testis TaxID=1622072 RepID=UPI00067E971F|nr:hypothetical protein [Bacillus testis]
MNSELYSFPHFEEWLQAYKEDPFASYLDTCTFPVFLYEFPDRYEIDAEQPGRQNKVGILCENSSLLIQFSKEAGPLLERRLELPMLLSEENISYQIEPPFVCITIIKTKKE